MIPFAPAGPVSVGLHVPGFPVAEQYVIAPVSVESQICPKVQLAGRLAAVPWKSPTAVHVFCAMQVYKLDPAGAFDLKNICPTAHCAGRVTPLPSLPCLVRSIEVCPLRCHPHPASKTNVIHIHRGVFMTYLASMLSSEARKAVTVWRETALESVQKKLKNFVNAFWVTPHKPDSLAVTSSAAHE